MTYDLRVRAVGSDDEFLYRQAAEVDPTDGDDPELDALQVADYIVFLFALDTYLGWYTETYGKSPADDETWRKGLMLLRAAERQNLESIEVFFRSKLEAKPSLMLLAAALRPLPNEMGIPVRALKLRLVLKPPAILKAVFGSSRKAVAEIRAAIDAATIDNPDAALNGFSVLVLKNKRLEAWVDGASDVVTPSGTGLVSPVQEAVRGVADATDSVFASKVQQDAVPGTDRSVAARDQQVLSIAKVEADATEAARKALAKAGEENLPLTRAEVIGVATATAAAIASAPDDIKNVPPALRSLDPEQRAAAMTGGKVRVSAGAGSGKCVKGDTLVRTTKGFIPIQEFGEGLIPDQSADLQATVLGLSGPEETSTIYHNGTRETVVLTTRLGYRLEGTHNHPILVTREGVTDWVRLGDVRDDDYIVIDRRPGFFPEEPFRAAHVPLQMCTNAKTSAVPVELTHQVAALLGYIISEGHTSHGKHSVCSLTTTDPDQLDLYRKAVDGIITKYSVFDRPGTNDPIYTMKFFRRSNLEALADFGLTYELAHNKEIPAGIFRSPKSVVVAFLRALFDGDGWFYGAKIGYGSASEEMSRQLHLLLLSFGIISSLRFKPNDCKGSWDISITGDNARLFLKEIGFNLTQKQQGAEAHFSVLKPNTNLDIIPGLAERLHAIHVKARDAGDQPTLHPKYHAFKCCANGTRNPSKAMLTQILAAYPTDCIERRELQEFVDAPWFYDSVDTLEASEAEVFDFVVPGTHSFSAGGFVNHNSTTLLSRTQFLIDSGSRPNRMVVMSFNKKAADELSSKMASKIGSDLVSTSKNPNPNGVLVGTMHSTFLKYINQYGTPAQVNIFAKVGGKGGMVAAGTLFKATKDIWDECFHNIHKDPPGTDDDDAPTRKVPEDELWKMPPKSGRMMKYLNIFQGQGMSVAEAKAWCDMQGTIEAGQAFKFFDIYEGLKGSAGAGWRPGLCGNRPSPKADKFIDFHRAGKPRIGDFNDMLQVFRDILMENPAARKKVQDQFDHVLVDECQDLNPLQSEVLQLMTEHIQTNDPKRSFWMVGDDKQCVSVDTMVSTPKGMRRLIDLHAGDEVLAYRNGEIKAQTVRHVVPSTWTWGYRVTTESGKTLLMSPNHKIWATDPVLEEEQHLVYLMFRRDRGYRVGVTNSNSYDRAGFSYGQRPQAEKAERLWVLGVSSTREDAMVEEASLSLRYQIPTQIFAMSEAKIDAVFTEFGRNGARLLEVLGLSFDYPNWMCHNSETNVARTIQLLGHGPKGTQVSLEWGAHESSLHDLTNADILQNGQRRLRKWFLNYREGLVYAEHLANKAGLNLSQRLSVEGQSLQKVTSASLVPKMSVAVLDGEHLTLERIITKDKVEGQFMDIDVDDASNFFGGEILSSNSIYQFRGADPQNFIDLDKKGFKDRQITTNYRCAPEFVDAANKLIAHNKHQIPMEAKAAPNRARGEATLTVLAPTDAASAAMEFGKKIDAAKKAKEPFSNYAVLSRTNAELAIYQQVCAVLGVPYVQKRAGSVFAVPETETFRAFLNSSVGSSPDNTQASFCQMLISGGHISPSKFSSDRVEGVKIANREMKKGLRAYCSRRRIDSDTFDPIVEARSNSGFIADILQTVMGTPAYGARKDAEAAEPLIDGLLQIREYLKDPKFTSRDLFEALLALPVTELLPPSGPGGGWSKQATTFRAATEKRLGNKIAQEESEEDPELSEEKSNLGALNFVQLMMEPNTIDPNYNPLDPKQFQARFDGLADLAEDLRIDPDVYEKKQNDAGVPLSERTPPPGVYLGTAHSTKGAEWPDVTLLMPKGVFPREPKDRPAKLNEVPEATLVSSESEREAERRLGYVGLTRAKNSLTVLCPGGLSPFILEAGLKVGQNVPQPETLTPGAVPATNADVAEAEEPEDWGQVASEVTDFREKTATLSSLFALNPYRYDRSAK